MKWYKRDPDAFFAATRSLTLEQRGAYNDLLEMLYARDGNVPDDDRFMARNLACRPQVWRRLKSDLIGAGKVHIIDGKLTANRVENELKTARKLMANMGELGRVSAEKRSKNNGTMPTGPLDTTTTTTTTREERKDASRPKERNGATRRPRAKTPLDEAWIPEGLPQQDVAEFDRFRDHARKNDTRYANWEAAWRNWKTSPYRKANGNGRSGSILEAADRLIDRLGGEEAARNYVPRSWGPGNPEFDAERERETQQKHLDFRKGANGLRLISKG